MFTIACLLIISYKGRDSLFVLARAKCLQVDMFLLCVALKTNLTKTWQETESPAGITVQLHSSDYSLDGVTHPERSKLWGCFFVHFPWSISEQSNHSHEFFCISCVRTCSHCLCCSADPAELQRVKRAYKLSASAVMTGLHPSGGSVKSSGVWLTLLALSERSKPHRRHLLCC